MKLEAGFPSFKSFKSLLSQSLSELGFSAAGDIAVKDISEEARGQVIVAGNSYYLSISLQLAMPCAAKSLSKVMAKHGFRERFNSGKVYNPVLSASVLDILYNEEDMRHAVEKADWPRLCANVGSLARSISSAYEAIVGAGLLIQAPWWPERLTEEQLSMLVVGLKRMGQADLLNFVGQRYLSRAAGTSSFGRYEQFLSEASEQVLTAR